ncbi:MAG: hypothetical protein GEV06_15525 [Luteitalea sp.]|nr:hypothetical protein [Luteitalea sp.]
MMMSERVQRLVFAGAFGAAIIGVVAGGAASRQQGATDGTLQFRAQEIAGGFGVGYAITTGDVNGDDRTDVLAINETDLVWFEAPSWEKHVIVGAGATVEDNVCLAAHDIDGDGRLDVALGAGWTGENTGTLQWVRQGEPGANPAWEVFPISAERRLHRINWADVDGDGTRELIVAPLHGRDSKGPDWEGEGARLLVFKPPANPRGKPWPMEVADDKNHIMHNVLPMNLDDDPQDELITASREGLYAIKRDADGTWSRTLIGEGQPGEVRAGRVGGRRMLATVEPWHGTSVVIYTEQQPGRVWARTEIESALTEGHALGWADFDDDGDDELAVGWRGSRDDPKRGLAIYSVDREGALQGKVTLDEDGMAAEDLVVADLNGDGRPDIAASGRATANVKIYWNETGGSSQ